MQLIFKKLYIFLFSFPDLDERYQQLSEVAGALARLNGLIDFGMFRSDLEAALERELNTPSRLSVEVVF